MRGSQKATLQKFVIKLNVDPSNYPFPLVPPPPAIFFFFEIILVTPLSENFIQFPSTWK